VGRREAGILEGADTFRVTSRLKLFGLLAVSLVTTPAMAATVLYQGVPGDRAAFLASVGASVTYTETFETVPVAKDTAVATFSQGGITYTRGTAADNVWVTGKRYDNFGVGVGPVITSVLTANGDERFSATFATPADVVAMDVYLNGLGPLSIKFYNGATLLGTALWNTGNDIRFLGFKDALPVTRFDFLSTRGAERNTGIDNLAVASVAPVPLPAAAWLLLGPSGVGPKLLIVAELGDLPFGRDEANLFFTGGKVARPGARARSPSRGRAS